MIRAKEYVCARLAASAPLVAYLGSASRILFGYPNSFETMPMVTYVEIDQSDADRADDGPFAFNVKIQLDVWVDSMVHGSTTALSELVDAVMQAAGFSLDFSSDILDEDVRILHRVMRYATKLRADDIDGL